MKTSLLFKALFKFLFGFILVSVFVFLPSGTLQYKNGWLFLAVLFCPMLLFSTICFFKNPALLKKRLASKEDRKTQKIILVCNSLMFLFGFILAGIDYRFSLTSIPFFVSVIFSVLFVIFYFLYFEVLRENPYLSRTVKVEEHQEIIDSGLYGIVRHPMYTVTLFMFLSIPLILGSLLSLVVFLIYPILLIARIRDEEKLLEQELQSYRKYKKKVKYRLIPYLY